MSGSASHHTSPPPAHRGEVLVVTDFGLHCPAGDFYIDPWRTTPSMRAVITHAHSDHARAGAGSYLTSPTGAHVLRARLGRSAAIEPTAWGSAGAVTIGAARVSLHPAGHVLGSAQVRVEVKGDRGGVWVVSGDYKLQSDGVSEPFEPVRCDVFITESTFGLPVYRWPAPNAVMAEVNAWWARNAAEGVTSIVGAYSLGKAQRIIAGLDPTIGPILVHPAVEEMCGVYERCGVALPARTLATPASVRGAGGRGLLVTPSPGERDRLMGPGALTTPGGVRVAACSGWMQVCAARRSRGVDRGFVLSDHADWPGLLSVIEATGAARVGVTHGFASALSRWLVEGGRPSWVVPSRPTRDGAAGHEPTKEPQA